MSISPPLIGEGVHLLGDDVGGVAQGALEDLGEFEDRRRHLADSRSAPPTSRAVSTTRAMAPHVFGQEVMGAADRLQHAHGNRLKTARRLGALLGGVGLLGALRRFGLDLRRLLLDQLDQMVDDVVVLQAMVGTPLT